LRKEVYKMADVNLKPLGDRVIIAPIEEEDVTASGIVLPETAKEKPQKGTIVAVGPGARDDKGGIIPMSVKEGDVVLYGKYAGTEIKLPGGKTVLVVRESDIFAVVL
jgi:chaperonin GroES